MNALFTCYALMRWREKGGSEMLLHAQGIFGKPFNLKVDKIHEGLNEGLKVRDGGSEMGS